MHHIRPNYGVMYSFTFNRKHEIYFGCITKIWMRQKHLMSGLLKLVMVILAALMMVKLKLNFQKTLLFTLHVTIFIRLYPLFENHLDDPSYFQDKAILVPTNEEFDATNDYILD